MEIIALILSGVAIIATFSTALIPTIYNIKADKERKRLYPAVAVWNNISDNIDERMKGTTNASWFINLNELKKRSGQHCIYFVLRNEDRDYVMRGCTVKIIVEGSSISEVFQIGTINPKIKCILPIPEMDASSRTIICDIFYETEGNEKIQITVTIKTDAEKRLKERVDEIYLLKRKKTKLKSYKYNSESSKLTDILPFIRKEKLTLNYTNEEVKNDDTNRSSVA